MIARRLLRDKQQLAGDLANPAMLGLHGQLAQAMHANSGHGVLPDGAVEQLRQKWIRSLSVAEDYAVSARIHPLLLAASEDLPDDYAVEHHHLHAEHGFLWLEDAITDEVQGPGVRVLTWHAGTGYSSRAGGTVPGLEVNVWSEALFNGVVVLIPVGADFLPWGMPSAGWQGITDDIERHLSLATRYVLAFQTFVRMELPAMERVPLPRSQRRPMERLGLSPERGLTIIDLRHRKPSNRGDGGERTLTVRHVVRGHWHAYHVGPSHPLHSKTHDDTERVHIYVHPFLRGDENLPLAMTDRVHLARR